MFFPNSKVYFDGSHYIAIPHTERFTKRRTTRVEEPIILEDKSEEIEEEKIEENCVENYEENSNENSDITQKSQKIDEKMAKNTQKNLIFGKITTKKEIFNELYKEFFNLKTKEKKEKIIEKMLKYFESEYACRKYIEKNLERKKNNLISRRTRMIRKANLIDFNYFCTFTYDSAKLNELQFKKKLKNTLSHLSSRKSWKYIGVWERSPENNRLHFHGLFKIPQDAMVGEMLSVKDYSTKDKRMQTSTQNSYFNDNFGRSDFKELNPQDLTNAIGYLLKYIEKTGEKIVYSRGLYQYFISDILEKDVASRIGLEDKKLLLFDDFTCIDEGEILGKVSPTTISQMRKSN